MPTDTIHIDRVDFTGITSKGFKMWLVSGVYTDGRLGAFQADTMSPFAASLCKRAQENRYDARIQWRDWPGGKRITYVELAPDADEWLRDADPRPA